MKHIYRITNTMTEEVYIGQTNNPTRRWNEHKRKAKKSPYPLYSAIRHWGVENFVFEVIEECEDSMADEREQHWINEYNSERFGYNQVNVNETMRQKRQRTLRGQ